MARSADDPGARLAISPVPLSAPMLAGDQAAAIGRPGLPESSHAGPVLPTRHELLTFASTVPLLHFVTAEIAAVTVPFHEEAVHFLPETTAS